MDEFVSRYHKEKNEVLLKILTQQNWLSLICCLTTYRKFGKSKVQTLKYIYIYIYSCINISESKQSSIIQFQLLEVQNMSEVYYETAVKDLHTS